MTTDGSNGWDAIAAGFIGGGVRSRVGAAEVGAWARTLRRRASVLDAGCGSGEPLTRTLVESGCEVYAIDASPRMVEEVRRTLPTVQAACESVESSTFFGREYDGVLAWGLIFLLPPELQPTVVERLGAAVGPRGSLLLTAPAAACEWRDLSTGRTSVSLGEATYGRLLGHAGMRVARTFYDESGNHYLLAERSRVASPREITLRRTMAADVPLLHAFERDEASNALAGTKPRDCPTFEARWREILADPDGSRTGVTPRVILADGIVVGAVNIAPQEGRDAIGYWISREHWGRGIATRAVGLMLAEYTRRPLDATASGANLPSIRVLEKHGFRIIERRMTAETPRTLQRETVTLRLD